MKNKKVLILCTGNSCRSQMAEGILKFLNPNLEVYSAGTNISKEVHPTAIQVMQEIGIDISKNRTKTVYEFLNQDFDYVITVCDEAKESCPVFTGKVKKKLHIGFIDPAKAKGTQEEVLKIFREVRDEIYKKFSEFNKTFLKESNNN
ncbi:MAG: arsenate reductase ArsC [Leptonema sp. (in: bacteria)]